MKRSNDAPGIGGRFSLAAAIVAVVLLMVWSGVYVLMPDQVDASFRPSYTGEAAYNGWSKPDTQVHLPFVNGDPSWGWETSVVVQSTTDDLADVSLHYYDTNGTEADVVEDTLPARASRVYTTPEGFRGSLVISSTRSIAVTANESPLDLLWSGDGLMSYQGVAAGSGATDVILTSVHRAYYGWNSFFAVQNLASETVHVALTFYDPDGSPVLTQTPSLPPYSARWYDLAAMPGLPSAFVGSVRLEADGPIAVVGHNVNRGMGKAMAHNNHCLDQPAAHSIYFPHLARSDTSTIAVFNPSSIAAMLLIELYDQDGSWVSDLSTSVAPNGMASAFLGGRGWSVPVYDGFRGSAVLSADSSVLAIVGTDWPVDPVTMTGYTGVALTGRDGFAPFVCKASGCVTQLLVQNVGSSAADITVVYYDQDGDQAGMETVPVPAYASHYFDQDTASDLKAPFYGSAAVASTEPVAVVGFISAQEVEADFNASPTSGVAPLTVDFADRSSGPVLDWSWDFGDGESSTAQHPRHTFIAAGDYAVSLTVSGPGGSDAETKSDYISVSSPVPSAPTLYAISNPGGDGDYTVDWSDVAGADIYQLQEDDNVGFLSPTWLYPGSNSWYEVKGRGAARRFYRVQAHNSAGDSDWSNVRWVDVLWEAEPNDDALSEANGPLVSGLTYSGTFPEVGSFAKDYFYFELPGTGRCDVYLTNVAAGQDYDLALRDPDLALLGLSNEVGQADEHIAAGSLPPGRYYVQVYHYGSGGSSQPYHLRVLHERSYVYLPLVLRRWPPPPAAPTLYAIHNPGDDGSYTVSWSDSERATSYVLQEAATAETPGGGDFVTIYGGARTHYDATERGAARYHYRVKARNGSGDSDWSNVAWVDVLWEMEENDDASQADGPLVSDKTYQGYPDDVDDYYAFELTEPAEVTVRLEDFAPTSSSGDLLLYGPASDGERGPRIAHFGTPGHTTLTLGPHALTPGRYYIRVYTANNPSTTQPYRLRVTY